MCPQVKWIMAFIELWWKRNKYFHFPDTEYYSDNFKNLQSNTQMKSLKTTLDEISLQHLTARRAQIILQRFRIFLIYKVIKLQFIHKSE